MSPVEQIAWLRQQAFDEALPLIERARMVARAAALAADVLATLAMDEGDDE